MASLSVSVVTPGLPPPPGGLQQLALDVHVGLRALTTTRAIGISSEPCNVPDVEVIAKTRSAPLRLAVSSIRHLRRWKPDVVQAITWKVAAPVVPVVPKALSIYAHGAELVRPNPALGRLRYAVLDRADVVIANSAYTASLVGDMSRAPVRVVSPGVRLPATPSLRARRGDRLNVLAVGALVPRKGHDRLIRAVTAAASDATPIHLVVVGDGPERAALKALVASLDASRVVTLAGRLSPDELDAAYREADAFALLGHAIGAEFEGFGIVLLEAAAYGLPVVTTLTGGTADAVRPGQTALVVDDIDGAAEALRELWNDPALANRLGDAGLTFAADSTVDRRAEEFLAVYRELAL